MKISMLCSWLFQVVIALILGVMSMMKFTHQDIPVQLFTQLGMEPFGRYLIGSIELLTAILLLIPASVSWGALLGWGVMTGALIGHFTLLGVSGPMFQLALMAAANWLMCSAILIIRRDQVSFVRNMFLRTNTTQ